jgi:hypothetical protein
MALHASVGRPDEVALAISATAAAPAIFPSFTSRLPPLRARALPAGDAGNSRLRDSKIALDATAWPRIALDSPGCDCMALDAAARPPPKESFAVPEFRCHRTDRP